jgi:hypothetical protein
MDQYSLVGATHKKWPENGSDLYDNEYELLILKYDANHETLVEQIEGTLAEEEGRTPMEEEGRIPVEDEDELKTQSKLALEEGKDKNTHVKKAMGQIAMLMSNCDIKKNVVHHHMSIIASTHPSEDC